jgi:hypothetical protein
MAHRNSASLLPRALVVLLGALLVGCGAADLVGTVASAPARIAAGAPPSDLPFEPVAFTSASGSCLSGWFIPGEARAGVSTSRLGRGEGQEPRL